MKRRLIDWILCPQCGTRPTLHAFREETVDLPAPVASPACAFYCALLDRERPANEGLVPPCDACYRQEVVEGVLACANGHLYPIVDGIPRLLTTAEQDYADFFARRAQEIATATGRPPGPPAPVRPGRPGGSPGIEGDRRSARSFLFQWTVYREGDLTWFKEDADLRKQEFLYNLQTTPEELAGSTLLDGGCGNGELTRSIAEHGPEIVALDFSRSVEGARRRLFEKGFAVSHRVHYLQASVLELPLRPASFDMVHTSGVLHHTPSTYRAFRSIGKAAKPGGKLYVQLYRKREAWVNAINVTLRAVTTRLPLRLLYGLCYVASPVHAGLSRLVHVLRREPPPPRSTARERAVQMFDNYSPRFQYRHTVPEIMELFKSEGYVDLQDVTLENEARHMLAVLGRRAEAPQTMAASAPAAATVGSGTGLATATAG